MKDVWKWLSTMGTVEGMPRSLGSAALHLLDGKVQHARTFRSSTSKKKREHSEKCIYAFFKMLPDSRSWSLSWFLFCFSKCRSIKEGLSKVIIESIIQAGYVITINYRIVMQPSVDRLLAKKGLLNLWVGSISWSILLFFLLRANPHILQVVSQSWLPFGFFVFFNVCP